LKKNSAYIYCVGLVHLDGPSLVLSRQLKELENLLATRHALLIRIAGYDWLWRYKFSRQRLLDTVVRRIVLCGICSMSEFDQGHSSGNVLFFIKLTKINQYLEFFKLHYGKKILLSKAVVTTYFIYVNRKTIFTKKMKKT
jgi:hypothetical protein